MASQTSYPWYAYAEKLASEGNSAKHIAYCCGLKFPGDFWSHGDVVYRAPSGGFRSLDKNHKIVALPSNGDVIPGAGRSADGNAGETTVANRYAERDF